MEGFLRDLRYASRMLLRNPLYTSIALIILAVGIGATSAVFSVVNPFLFRPFPFPEPDRLVVVQNQTTGPEAEIAYTSYPDFIDWESESKLNERMGAYYETVFNLTGKSEPEQVPGAVVSSGLFAALGVPPLVGRSFSEQDDRPDGERVVIIGHGLWQRRFAAAPDLLGQVIKVDGQSATVIGVMPPGFKFPDMAALWVPVSFAAKDVLKDRSRRAFEVIARIRPDSGPEQFRAEMEAIAGRLASAYPDTNGRMGARIITLQERHTGVVKPVVLLLLLAVCFMMLIVCANVASLMLARATLRKREIAIRVALGAGRGQIIKQLLAESLLLSALGGLLGLALAWWGVSVLVSAIPMELPFWIHFEVDGRVLALTIVTSGVTGIIFGLVPALKASRPNLSDTMKEGGSISKGAGVEKSLRALVVCEIALALVLLVGAGLMIKGAVEAQDAELGFNPRNVLTMQITLPEYRYSQEPEIVGFYDRLLGQLEQMPAVRHVGLFNYFFPEETRVGQPNFTVEGMAPDASSTAGTPRQTPRAMWHAVSADYFRALEIPLAQGRYFGDEDYKNKNVAIINEKMARRFWPDEQAVGKLVKIGSLDSPNPWLSIVGVVGDTRTPLGIYVPHVQRVNRSMNLYVKTEGDPLSLASTVRDQIWATDEEQAVSNISTFEQFLYNEQWPQRAFIAMLGIFAIVGLVLAVVGIYGVMAYAVSQRTHEIGIRMALGARAGDVLRLILMQGFKLILMGLAIGGVLAYALARFLSSQVFGVGTVEVSLLVAIALALAAVALIASFIPARSATKVDPAEALRYE